MVKPIAVEVEVVRQAEGSLQTAQSDEVPPVLATVSGRGLTSQDSVGEGLAAVLARAASSSTLDPNAQKKGATPARTSAPARVRTPGSSGSSRAGKADGSKALSSGAARPKRPAAPSLAGLESACEAAMVSLAAGQTAPADASGTASKLLEQLAALQSTLAAARAAEGGLFELDEAGFDEDDSDDDEEPEADMDEAEENEYVAGGGGAGTDGGGAGTSGDDTGAQRRSGRSGSSGTSARTSGAPAAEGEGSESEGGARASGSRKGRGRRERRASPIPLDTVSGIEITEPDVMFDAKPLLDPTLAKRLDPMGCFPTCGGGEKRARSGKPDAALVAELNDPACEPLTRVHCHSNCSPRAPLGLPPVARRLAFATHHAPRATRHAPRATPHAPRPTRRPGWSTACSASGTTT